MLNLSPTVGHNLTCTRGVYLLALEVRAGPASSRAIVPGCFPVGSITEYGSSLAAMRRGVYRPCTTLIAFTRGWVTRARRNSSGGGAAPMLLESSLTSAPRGRTTHGLRDPPTLPVGHTTREVSYTAAGDLDLKNLGRMSHNEVPEPLRHGWPAGSYRMLRQERLLQSAPFSVCKSYEDTMPTGMLERWTSRPRHHFLISETPAGRPTQDRAARPRGHHRYTGGVEYVDRSLWLTAKPEALHGIGSTPWSGLESAPESRLRRAYLHLPCSCCAACQAIPDPFLRSAAHVRQGQLDGLAPSPATPSPAHC